MSYSPHCQTVSSLRTIKTFNGVLQLQVLELIILLPNYVCCNMMLHVTNTLNSWDGGDCCPWTCKAGTDYCGYAGYKCKNPAYAACSLANAAPSRNLAWVGDGFCDSHLNNKDCGFDMGDCCQVCVYEY
jgi:hypothetical protein